MAIAPGFRFRTVDEKTRGDSQRMRTALLVAVSGWVCVLVALASLSPQWPDLQPVQYKPALEVTLALSPFKMDPPLPKSLPTPSAVPVHSPATPRPEETPKVEQAPVQTMPEPLFEAEPSLPQPPLSDLAPAEMADVPDVAVPSVVPESPGPADTPSFAAPLTAPIRSPKAAAMSHTLPDVGKVGMPTPVGMKDLGSTATKAYTPRLPENAPSPDTLLRLDAAITEKLKYPVQARKRGIQGTVVLSMAVDNVGRLTLCVLEKSSGSSLLDEAGLKLLKGLFPFPGGFASAFQTRIAIAYNLD